MNIKKLAKEWRIDIPRISVNNDNLTVGGSLYLQGTEVTSLPDNLTVGGSLDLQGTGVTSLPDNLTVGGYLDLRDTGVTSLPDNFTVGGSLYLRDTGVTSLPDNLTVGGSLYLRGTGITAANVKETSDDFFIKLKFSIECKFNLKGFTIADGILAKIISTKDGIKKIIVWGKKEASYLVTDGNGNYAHGKTIKEAREDLVYKIVAKFEGELPKSAIGKEWIGIYRAVTGACSSGVKGFVNEVGIVLDKTYTCTEIAELTKGRYGYEKFIDKMRGSL